MQVLCSARTGLAHECNLESVVLQARSESSAVRQDDAQFVVRLLLQSDPLRRMRIHVPGKHPDLKTLDTYM